MPRHLDQDATRVAEILHSTSQYAAQVLSGIAQRPVASVTRTTTGSALSQHGMGFDGALEDFRKRWEPGFSGSAGPRYLGFVTGGATPAALAGDWLTSTFDQNPTSGLDSSAPDLERETIAWMRELFGLSAEHHGAFVTGATMSNLVGMAIGREWIGDCKGVNVSEEGVAALKGCTVLSGSAHSSIYKGLSVLGLGRAALKPQRLQHRREAVDVAALEQALQTLDDEPCIVVANAGTVNTVDFDDLEAIAALKAKYRFWLHVDGAFGSFAALSPRFQSLVAGMDAADSLCLDCHKWLNVPYDSAVQFTRRRDLQLRVFQNSAAYLGMPTENPDFVHLTPENSRRLRALATWFALAAYGRAGHREIVERNVACAQALGRLLSADSDFALLAPVRMNVACFTLAGNPTQAEVQGFLKRLSEGGAAFLTSTVLDGTWALRAAFSNWRSTEDDVTRVYQALRKALTHTT